MDKFNSKLVPDIRFTPYAWQKMLYFFNKGETEVSGWGIAHEDDPSLIIDFRIVDQECTVVTTEMTDRGLTDYLNEIVDDGYTPGEAMRYWCHCHPGNSPTPSGTDEEQFDEFMDKYPWICMIIISHSLDTYCRVGFNQGPGGTMEMTVGVDWTQPIEYTLDFNELDLDYKEKVHHKITPIVKSKFSENYDNINWKAKDSISSRWSNSNHNYTNTNFGDDLEEADSLDEEEWKQCYMEYLNEKPLHQLTEEEFNELQELSEELED